uniref:Protein kinase domain-containing protein n=1 Tax=Parastrongyloides trichosuri TaxID=131310 RepID=A0A0N4ZVD3_PARTI
MDFNEVVPNEKLKIPSFLFNPTSGKRYKLMEIITNGVFGYIYAAIEHDNYENIVIKILSTNGFHVSNEIQKILQSDSKAAHYLLNIYDVSPSYKSQNPFIVMEIGEWKNFEEIVNINKELIPYSQFLRDSLSTIQYLHNKGFIHNSLYPSSFWYKENSPESDSYSIKLADYEYCFQKIKTLTKEQEYTESREILKIYDKRSNGKPHYYNYCALSHHKETKNCMKNDVESIFYIFVEYCEGKLPWCETSENEKCVIKEKIDMRQPNYDFFYFVPIFLREIIRFIDNMPIDGVPNYEKIFHRIKYQETLDKSNDAGKITDGDKGYMNVLLLYTKINVVIPERRKKDIVERNGIGKKNKHSEDDDTKQVKEIVDETPEQEEQDSSKEEDAKNMKKGLSFKKKILSKLFRRK